MKLFSCDACGQTLYFHNVQCTRCGNLLGFVPQQQELHAFEPVGDAVWRPFGEAQALGRFRTCGNYARYAACNWMVHEAENHPLCIACRLNRTIPDLSVPGNLMRWQRLQSEKNRLVYALLRFGLLVMDKQQAPRRGLAFDFLADDNPQFREGPRVVVGHSEGVITLDIAEADDAARERLRQQMAEPYRTVLGHFRHESGHYYWDRLVRDTSWLQSFRSRFGDERADYGLALDQHYHGGLPANWQQQHVSAYASCHPWEDWAETWAHYLHIIDTLETAWQFGLRLDPLVSEPRLLTVDQTDDPYACSDLPYLVDRWLALAAVLNSLNHSMGQADAYPFVLAPAVIDKLSLVHDIIRDGANPQGA
jgi:hypothetical protein